MINQVYFDEWEVFAPEPKERAKSVINDIKSVLRDPKSGNCNKCIKWTMEVSFQ